MKSSIVASEVVLPEPVGPVTMKRPRGRRISSLTIGGSPISSKVSSVFGISRSTIATSPRCRKTATRKRASVAVGESEVALDPTSCSSCWFCSGVIDFIKATHVVGVQRLGLEIPKRAVEPDRRGTTHREVEVRAVLLDDGVEQAIDLKSGHGERTVVLRRPGSDRPDREGTRGVRTTDGSSSGSGGADLRRIEAFDLSETCDSPPAW